MKIAITSTGNNLHAKMDARFGRCSFFAVYDTVSLQTDFFENPNKDAAGGAGPASAQFIASKGVESVYSGDFGAKVKEFFDQLKITMLAVAVNDKTIQEVINQIK